MCLYPRIIRNPKYKENKKNGGVIPPYTDHRVTKIPIGCSQCMECRKKKKDEWTVRLMEDVKQHKNGKFVTFTFSNESYTELAKNFNVTGYELDNAIATLAVRRFTERWRKKYKKTIRHWFVTELGHGQTEHLHLHGIIWAGKDDKSDIKEIMDEVEKIWSYGWIWKGREYRGKLENYVNEKTATYISKYMLKVDPLHKEYKSIILTSKGIGKKYVESPKTQNNKYKGEETRDYYISDSNRKMSLPIYYRNYIYTEEQREALWINKLDKQKRYVLGVEVDFSSKEGEIEYYIKLNEARKTNKKYGFGVGHKNWNRLEYEEQLRGLKQEERGVTKQKIREDRKTKEIFMLNMNNETRLAYEFINGF